MDIGLILAILVLILLNGFFSGSEIALITLREAEVGQLTAERSRRARRLAWLRAAPVRLFATVQIGVTIVGSLASVLGGASLVAALARTLRSTGYGPLTAHAELLAVVIVVGVISYLSLVFGELVPKSLGQRYNRRIALSVAPILHLFARLTAPLVWLLTASSNLVLRLFGDVTSFGETRLTLEELRIMLRQSTEKGVLQPRQRSMLEGIIEMPELDARHAMVSRMELQTLALGSEPDELRSAILSTPHEYLLVLGKDIDDVQGVLPVKAALLQLATGKQLDLAAVMQRPVYVPELMSLDDVLRKMLTEQLHFVVVVDELGGTAGALSLDDVLEQIVGDIRQPGETAPPPAVQLQEDGSALVAGRTPVHEVNDALELDLPVEGPYETIGGLVTHLFGAIPPEGEQLELGKARLEVVSRSEKRVRLVKITRRKEMPKE